MVRKYPSLHTGDHVYLLKKKKKPPCIGKVIGFVCAHITLPSVARGTEGTWAQGVGLLLIFIC